MIRIENFKEGETIHYALPLIRGRIYHPYSSFTVRNRRYDDEENISCYLSSSLSEFKALIPLKEGKNKIEFTLQSFYDETEITTHYLHLHYDAAPRQQRVRFYYATANDEPLRLYDGFHLEFPSLSLHHPFCQNKRSFIPPLSLLSSPQHINVNMMKSDGVSCVNMR